MTGLYNKLAWFEIRKIVLSGIRCQVCDNNDEIYWFMPKTFKEYNKRMNE